MQMTFKEQAEKADRQRIKEWIRLYENAGVYLKKSNGEYKTTYEILNALSKIFKKEKDLLNDNPASKHR